MPSDWPDDAHPMTRVVGGDGGTSVTFAVPAGVVLAVESVVATVDTTGAASTPRIVIEDNAGEVINEKRQTTAIPAGTTDRATWALRLADDGGGTATAPFVGGRIRRDAVAGVQAVPSGFLNARTVQLQHNVIDYQTGVTAFTTAGNSRLVIVTAGVYFLVAELTWTPAGAGEYGMFVDGLVAGGVDTGAQATTRRIVAEPNIFRVSTFVRCNAGAVITQGIAQSSGVNVNAGLGLLQVTRLGPLV